jgi:hypothetical protein
MIELNMDILSTVMLIIFNDYLSLSSTVFRTMDSEDSVDATAFLGAAISGLSGFSESEGGYSSGSSGVRFTCIQLLCYCVTVAFY